MKRFLTQPLMTWIRNTIRHPKHRWWIIGGALVYLLSPIDISPDAFPILGWIDDTALITLLAAEVVQVVMEQSKTFKTRTKTTSTDANATETVIDTDAVSIS